VRAAGFSMQQILGIINLALDINATETQQMRRWFTTKDNADRTVSVVPHEAVSFTLSSLASWSTNINMCES